MLPNHPSPTMYQTSQQYAGGSSYTCPSSLEGIAQVSYGPASAVTYAPSSENIAYSTRGLVQATPPIISYGPSISSLGFSGSSSPAASSFQYFSSAAQGRAYSSSSSQYQFCTLQQEYHFAPENFLKPGKEGMFVGEAEQIRPFIEKAFEEVLHIPFLMISK